MSKNDLLAVKVYRDRTLIAATKFFEDAAYLAGSGWIDGDSGRLLLTPDQWAVLPLPPVPPRS